MIKTFSLAFYFKLKFAGAYQNISDLENFGIAVHDEIPIQF
jgi:hypothetical protein